MSVDVCAWACVRATEVCALDNMVEKEKTGYRDTLEDKPRDGQKVKRQNKLVVVVFSFSRTFTHSWWMNKIQYASVLQGYAGVQDFQQAKHTTTNM